MHSLPFSASETGFRDASQTLTRASANPPTSLLALLLDLLLHLEPQYTILHARANLVLSQSSRHRESALVEPKTTLGDGKGRGGFGTGGAGSWVVGGAGNVGGDGELGAANRAQE